MKLFRRKKNKPISQAGRYSARPDVFSYHASRSSDNASVGRLRRSDAHQNRLSLKTLPTLIATAVIIYSVGYLFVLETTPRIVILGEKDKATLLQDTAVYLQASKDILKGSVLNRSKITINTETTAQHLKSRFPELKEVSITIPIASHRPVFELEPATPKLILASSKAGPYVIDEQGRAVVKADKVTSLGRVDLPKVSDESGLELRLGQSVLPKEDIKFIANVYAQLRAMNLSIDSMTLPTLPNELHVRLTGDRYFIKFDISGDARLQSGALAAVKEELRIKNVNPSQYLDVRVKDKAFYK